MLWFMYLLGWFLLLSLQIQNSLRSNTNGLGLSWAGIKSWLSISAIQTAIRLACVIAIFPAVIKGPLTKMDAILVSAGFPLQAWGLALFGGFTCECLLYQIFGMIPGLRKEVADVVPPPADPPK